MKNYYERPSNLSLLMLYVRALFQREKLDSLSLLNQAKDFKALLNLKDKDLWELHKDLASIRLTEARENFENYSYGYGYYYQSIEEISLSGFRSTQDRIESLSLLDVTRNQRVLDVGTNIGAIPFSIRSSAASIDGVDNNYYLIATANRISKHLKTNNINFYHITFEKFTRKLENEYDVVLSLANHATYDGNTTFTLDEYFQAIAKALKPDGTLVFESHPSDFEPKSELTRTISIIEKYFDLGAISNSKNTTFLDANRVQIRCLKK